MTGATRGIMNDHTERDFLTLCCLTYDETDPPRPDEAAGILRDLPELTRISIFAAAGAGDVEALRDALDADPSAVNTIGGPFVWPALLYAVYSRFTSREASGTTLEAVDLLLRRGADPNARFTLNGLPVPFTALTGAFGKGEDSKNQPPHPEALRCARLLLQAGADPNDEQSLYNLQFEPSNDHLRLLFEFGLGNQRGNEEDDHRITRMLGSQLLWAVEHNYVERVGLLLEHSVSPEARYSHRPEYGSRSANVLAYLLGNSAICAMFRSAGSEEPLLSPSEALMARCMLDEEIPAESLPEAGSPVVRQAIAEFPHAVMRATTLHRPMAVERLVRLGFNVNFREGRTPLHQAAMEGDLDLVKRLVWLGADPDIRDSSHQSTPAGWARYFGATEVAEYLESGGEA